MIRIKTHLSTEFSSLKTIVEQDAYMNIITGNPHTDNKGLMVIPGASHTDFYYKMDVISFDDMETLFNKHIA